MFIYGEMKIEDWQELHDVALSSWLFTYKNIYSEEFINKFIEENYSEKSIKSALDWAKENNGFNYVAKNDNKIIGYITFGTFENTWRLWRIYLLPKDIGKGIGNELLKRGEKFILDKGAKNYFLLVHKDNKV